MKEVGEVGCVVYDRIVVIQIVTLEFADMTIVVGESAQKPPEFIEPVSIFEIAAPSQDAIYR